jgi:hypothetical protein
MDILTSSKRLASTKQPFFFNPKPITQNQQNPQQRPSQPIPSTTIPIITTTFVKLGYKHTKNKSNKKKLINITHSMKIYYHNHQSLHNYHNHQSLHNHHPLNKQSLKSTSTRRYSEITNNNLNRIQSILMPVIKMMMYIMTKIANIKLAIVIVFILMILNGKLTQLLHKIIWNLMV